MTTSLILVLMVIAFIGAFLLRNFLTKRAIFKVIDLFYQQHAVGVQGAKTQHELGLVRPNLLERMTKPRDYKQFALQILIKKGIIEMNLDGRLYLVEENLNESLRRRS
jgi:hypothetical protein